MGLLFLAKVEGGKTALELTIEQFENYVAEKLRHDVELA
jgi:hypothetical protein